jgi:hypothetical protein
MEKPVGSDGRVKGAPPSLCLCARSFDHGDPTGHDPSADRSGVAFPENPATFSVKAGFVNGFFETKPHHEALIGATALVFHLTGPPFSFFRARLQHLDHTPKFSGFAKAFHQLVRGPGKSHSRKICEYRSGLYPFKDIDPGPASGTEYVGFAQRYSLVP